MDVLRHTMKERGRERMLESLAAAPTPEDSHRLLLTMTKEMNPSDQGNLAEDWYRRVVLGLTDEGAASGAWKQHARIPARDGVSMERFADAVHNGAVHEVKSGASLTKRDKGQIRDYFMAVQMHKEVAGIPVNRVELVLTNPSALLASKNRLAELFKEGGEMLQVTVFDARGVPHGIRSKAELERMVGA